ncbi:MAG: hypothetical protein HFH67_11665 [Lachnospiraceae bacterium]|nr:hypothetical protein [Lachnospiraceae bacterium]
MAAEKSASRAADDSEKTDKGKLYTKEQILSSAKYMARRDVLEALLKDGREYTLEETDMMVKEFMERKVQ